MKKPTKKDRTRLPPDARTKDRRKKTSRTPTRRSCLHRRHRLCRQSPPSHLSPVAAIASIARRRHELQIAYVGVLPRHRRRPGSFRPGSRRPPRSHESTASRPPPPSRAPAAATLPRAGRLRPSRGRTFPRAVRLRPRRAALLLPPRPLPPSIADLGRCPAAADDAPPPALCLLSDGASPLSGTGSSWPPPLSVQCHRRGCAPLQCHGLRFSRKTMEPARGAKGWRTSHSTVQLLAPVMEFALIWFKGYKNAWAPSHSSILTKNRSFVKKIWAIDRRTMASTAAHLDSAVDAVALPDRSVPVPVLPGQYTCCRSSKI